MNASVIYERVYTLTFINALNIYNSCILIQQPKGVIIFNKQNLHIFISFVPFIMHNLRSWVLIPNMMLSRKKVLAVLPSNCFQSLRYIFGGVLVLVCFCCIPANPESMSLAYMTVSISCSCSTDWQRQLCFSLLVKYRSSSPCVSFWCPGQRAFRSLGCIFLMVEYRYSQKGKQKHRMPLKTEAWERNPATSVHIGKSKLQGQRQLQ